jgi:hypothetical protein
MLLILSHCVSIIQVLAGLVLEIIIFFLRWTFKVVQASKFSIIALFFLIFASHGISGGLNFGSGHIGYQQKMAPHQKFGYSTRSYGHIQKHGLKFPRPLKHRKYPYRFIYDPRFVSYAGKQSEKIGKVELNVNIIVDQGGEPNEHTAKKDKPISPPHIVTLHDIAPDAKKLNSSKRPGSVILIRGTHIILVQTASD